MLWAWTEASVGNHGMISATGIPIATAITPMTSICNRGRLRTVLSSLALEHQTTRHPMRSERRTAPAATIAGRA